MRVSEMGLGEVEWEHDVEESLPHPPKEMKLNMISSSFVV